MAPIRSLAVVTFIFLLDFSQATYSASASTNLAVYWGQGPNQQRLLHFCQQSTIDIIPIGFVDYFPAQGNGFPGDNFGNQCYGGSYVYAGPGNDSADNQLQTECPNLVADIPVCQSQYGKKIILSLGGGIDTYGLTGVANGTAFADFLWGAFGPQTSEWLAKGLPRPFDGPNNQSVEVDGFDFDIEFPSADNQAGYIAMIKTLRRHFGGAKKPYLITGAPQCVVPDANMGQMISQAQFDIIWIQYYNTPQCSAVNWVTANPNYTSTGIEEPSGFSFDAWERFLVGTASSNAKLYIGLPGGPGTFYLSPTEASSLIRAYYCKPNFGGIMIWEATAAENNDVGCGETYYEAVKGILVADSLDGTLDCVVPPASPPPTSSTSMCTVSSTTTTSVSSTITPTPPCTEVYVVVNGDYCYAIWTEFGITEAQLYAWNPTLDANCDLSIGQVLCVAESTSTSTTTTGVSTTTTSTSTSATATACTEHYTVVSGDTCYAIWTEFGITEAQLLAYNPTLDTNCDLSIGQVLCVSESPTTTSSSSSVTSTSTTTSATATPSACTKYYTVVSGDSCYAIWTEFGISEAQLYAFNPTLDTSCDLSIGQVLCVSESPTSTSSSLSITSTSTTASVSATPSACTEYYTVVSGDYCYLIYTKFGITEAQLYAYNPTLDTNCDLSIGQVLCVSESPTSTSSSSISTTSLTTSSSTSPSTTASCTKYYTVVSGDYCYLIYTEFGITEAQLYAYNPSLDTNCDLSIGQVLCVSESPLSSTSSSVTSTSISSSKSGTSTKSSTSSSTATSNTSTSSSSKSTSTSSSSKSTTTSSSIHITTSSTTSSIPITTPLICNSDNCLRQLQHSSASAASFCATYTKTINTASTGLPTSVSNCQSSYVRISSACSCLVSTSSTTTTTRSTSATQTTVSTKTNDSSVITSTTQSTSATKTSSTKTNDSSVITSSTGTTLKTSTSKSTSSSAISASFTP